MFFNLNFCTVPSIAARPQKEQWLTSKLSGMEGSFYDLQRDTEACKKNDHPSNGTDVSLSSYQLS